MNKVASNFLKSHPDLEKVEFIFVDINGIPRGKNTSPKTLIKAFNGDLRMPVSSYALDIWGDNPQGTGLVMSGDGDGICRPVESSLAITPWNNRQTAQCLVSMEDGNGKPIFADSRHILNSVINKYTELGLKPVMAPEMEFYLIDKHLLRNGHPQRPLIPGTEKRYQEVQLLDLIEVDDFEDFFALVERSALSIGIPAETAIKECAPGQFEINLRHHDDALLMADQTFLLKRLIKNCARKFNMNATFMAKPFPNHAGNGMHVHLSINNMDGNNVFVADKNKQPKGIFAHAIGGLLKSSSDFFSFYAPHSNSYRRIVHNANHAPTTLSWGNENRTALIRIPEASPSTNRLEFRAASADTNPYLVFASILSSALVGIKNQYPLEKETLGNAHEQHEPILDMSWSDAVQKTSKSKTVKKYFGKHFQQCYQCIKESEIKRFHRTITDFEYHSYLRSL